MAIKIYLEKVKEIWYNKKTEGEVMAKIFYEKWSTPVHAARRKGYGFASHMHGETEIILLTSGRTELVCDGKRYTLSCGDAAVVFPNHTHAYSDDGSCDGYFIIAKADCISAFGQKYKNLDPESPVVHLENGLLKKVSGYFDDAVEYFNKRPEFVNEKLNALTVLILSELLPKIRFSGEKEVNMDAASDVFAYCNRNFDSDITLDSVAGELNISKDHIMRIFREKLDTTFRNYITAMRVDKAKNLLLTTDKSVTEISILCGFNTIRSFNRAFLARTGMSPSDFRK